MSARVSVVIPSYNRRNPLVRLLDSLAEQTLPAAEFEVFVVLDGSSDGSAAAVHGRDWPFALQVIEQVNAGAGAARNAGAALARGEFLLFVDDDIVLAPGALESHLQAARRCERSAFVGHLNTVWQTRNLEPLSHSLWSQLGRLEDLQRIPTTWCYSGNLLVPRSVFLEAGGFTAFTTTFEDLGTLRQLPGLAVQRLMADGYGFGAEGDWKTAMLVRITAVMGAGRPGGSSLMEDYTYHMVPGQELSLGAHMLEVNPALSSQRARLDVAPLSIGGKEDPVRLVFTADPGPAIVVALSDMRDRFRMVAAEVECVPLPAPMPNLPVGHAVWRSKPDFRTAATAWLAAGASHHTAMSNQLTTRVMQDFATMTGVELLVIDDSTTIESAERELRLNSAIL